MSFPHSFLLWLFPLKTVINGHPGRTVWGRMVVPMPPGQHHLRVYMNRPVMIALWVIMLGNCLCGIYVVNF